MLTAFVLINTQPSEISAVAQKVANLANVTEVYSVAGDIDIIAIVRLEHYDDLDQAVPEALAKIPGITRTRTTIAFRRFGAKDLAWDVGGG